MTYQDAISGAAKYSVLNKSFPAPNTDSKLAAKIAQCKAEGRPALVGYLPVGYPSVEESIAAAIELGKNGADIIELGIPYSDPVMDGPVIQKATEEAIENGFRLTDTFRATREITAACDAVVTVMTYWNPILRFGVDEFAREFSEAGGSGLITPDLVPNEASEWFEVSEKYGLDRIFLAAISSSTERLHMISEASSGFVYAVSVMGVTGARSSVNNAAHSLVENLRSAGAPNVCVGLGVSKREHVEEIGAYADGVIVGTALVKALQSGGPEAVGQLARELAGRQ
ncbi:tryptophan synthase subunit alpha [Rothia amarae]|uniref:Tryptophan synthase alpha chain n=1 Tax=Rothia amarae TaxID=169480 RepID=A0A7H2BHG8_9MICC|nr:tryptophan synthase subunit alpha [Rothia amarae]QNV39114.1 tryptophan synthase subunit alpha [Rothia amarae]SIK95560.1 tryptophan synthase subunit alpha [Mycobacteroides abscessus subsp. abscessus]